MRMRAWAAGRRSKHEAGSKVREQTLSVRSETCPPGSCIILLVTHALSRFVFSTARSRSRGRIILVEDIPNAVITRVDWQMCTIKIGSTRDVEIAGETDGLPSGGLRVRFLSAVVDAGVVKAASTWRRVLGR